MNPSQNNYAAQNKKVPQPNKCQSPIANPIQPPLNNPNQIIKSYDSPQLKSKNKIPSVYGPVNKMPPQINLTEQTQNIGVSQPNLNNLNIIQPQNLNQNISDI